MLTYFAVRRAEKVFAQYKALTVAYWRARPPDNRDWMTSDRPAPENEASILLRGAVMHLFPEAEACARELGISVMAKSFPMPAVGGPVLPVNLLYAVMNDSQGHEPVPQREIFDLIDRCLATATAHKKKLFWSQLLNPLWWLIHALAYLIRIPFLILRHAGLPPNVEESIWGHAIKVVIFIGLTLASLHWGLKLSAKDVLNFVK